MNSRSTIDVTDGDALVGMLGLSADDPRVGYALERLARGMTPELDPDDEETFVDWITINEIGLEFGFEDEAYVKALNETLRRQGPLLLSQVYFYGDTEDMRPFPYTLPFGLAFADNREIVRQKLLEFEPTRRSYIRDVWRLPNFILTVAYRQADGLLESILCQVPYSPWPPSGELQTSAPITPSELVSMFGLRWSDRRLRTRLAMFHIDEKIAEIRSEHEADLRFAHGIELMFTEGRKLKRFDPAHPRSLTFAAATFYASRENDAREWNGELPFGLAFDDSQTELFKKVNGTPSKHEDDADELVGLVEWNFKDFTLSVIYSNVENRILRVSVMDPGF